MSIGTIGTVVGGLVVVAFILVFVGAFSAIAYFQFKAVRRMFSRELKPGEVFVSHRLGSRSVETIRNKPGRYWFFPNTQVKWDLLRINEAVFVMSEPTEIQAEGGVFVILTVRLTLDVNAV